MTFLFRALPLWADFRSLTRIFLCADKLAEGVDLGNLPQPVVVRPCTEKKGKGKKDPSQKQEVPGSSAPIPKKLKVWTEVEPI